MGVTGVPSDADAEPLPQRARWPAGLPDRDLPAPRLARTITIVVLLCLSIVVSLNSLEYSADTPTLAASVAIVLAVFLLQFLHSSARAQRWTTRTRVLMLLTQAVFTYAPVLIFHRTWVSMTGPLAGSILLLVPFPRAWIPFAATVAVPASFQLVVSLSWLETSYLVLSTLFTGLVIYGLSRLTDLVQEVHRSRAELARLAVSQERLRFSRDLHDLLGYSLSAITLKSELIYRLVPGRPEQAREEVASLLGISRQALSDVRTVASGYRDMSLAAEADSAAAILASADVEAEVEIACGHLHPVIDTVLATALREGVTNILRHSKVETCRISAVTAEERVTLTLTNDGVPDDLPALSPHSGSGIGNLKARLGAVGGRLEAERTRDGCFRMVAEAPTRPIAARTTQDRMAARPAA